MKKFSLLVFILFLTSYVYANNSASAIVQATVVSSKTPIVVKTMNYVDKTIEVIGKVGDNNCPMTYSVIVKKNDTIKSTQNFTDCYNVIRTKIINNKLLIVMVDNQENSVSYWQDIDN